MLFAGTGSSGLTKNTLFRLGRMPETMKLEGGWNPLGLQADAIAIVSGAATETVTVGEQQLKLADAIGVPDSGSSSRRHSEGRETSVARLTVMRRAALYSTVRTEGEIHRDA